MLKHFNIKIHFEYLILISPTLHAKRLTKKISTFIFPFTSLINFAILSCGQQKGLTFFLLLWYEHWKNNQIESKPTSSSAPHHMPHRYFGRGKTFQKKRLWIWTTDKHIFHKSKANISEGKLGKNYQIYIVFTAQ